MKWRNLRASFLLFGRTSLDTFLIRVAFPSPIQSKVPTWHILDDLFTTQQIKLHRITLSFFPYPQLSVVEEKGAHRALKKLRIWQTPLYKSLSCWFLTFVAVAWMQCSGVKSDQVCNFNWKEAKKLNNGKCWGK